MLEQNSPPMILERIRSGRVGWAGPLIVTAARTGLILFVQVVVATVFLIRGAPAPWRAQAPWWTVYATLVDIGCLLLLWRQRLGSGDARFSLESGSQADGDDRRDARVMTHDEQSSLNERPAHRRRVSGRSQAHDPLQLCLVKARQVDRSEGRGQYPALPK